MMLTSSSAEIGAMHYSLPSSFFLFFGIQNKTVVGSVDVSQRSSKKRSRKRKNQQTTKPLLVLPIVCEIFI